MDLFAPQGAIKFTLWYDSRKNGFFCRAALYDPIVEKYIFWSLRGKKCILLVRLLSSLGSSIDLHIRKINFFLPSCIIYYNSIEKFAWTNKKIVHCATREKKIYFASVKFDARAKRG